MTAPVLAGTVIADRYHVERVLGEGGMGVVVLATHLVLQQKVAIKFLRREVMFDADVVARFLREARAAAKVQSDRVVRVHDVATLADGTPYIVMEYFEGNDLATILTTRGPLPVQEAVRYMLQTCEALAETHAAGIIHGDLKPENIYIARSSDGVGRVKLLDFGISKIVMEDKTTGLPNVAGTPCYMAPEQLEHGSFDLRADLWSLGTVLYELLVGQPPFLADTPEEICKRVVRSQLPPIRRQDVPEALRDVIVHCLAKDPARRFASATELALALEPHTPHRSSASHVDHITSRPAYGTTSVSGLGIESAGPPTSRFSRIVGVVVAMTVVALVVCALVFAGVFRRSGQRVAVVQKTVATPAAASATAAPPEPSSATAPPPAPPDAPSPVSEAATASVPAKSSHSPRRPRAPRSAATAPPSEEAPPSDGDRFGTRK
jgi:eukaryotic-like serine/threonine-protein kinase